MGTRSPELLRHYMALIWPRFWRRGIDIESYSAIDGVLAEAAQEAGLDRDEIEASFAKYASADGPGTRALAAVVEAAEEGGVFGVPSYLLDGELFWGREHLPLIRMRLHDLGLARRPDVTPDFSFVYRG